MLQFDILVLLISLFFIGLVSNKFVTYVSEIADIFGLSQMAAGFILLSLSTSLPELLVSVIASLIGEGGLSFGNVLGSNIANLTIIMGLAIIFSRTIVSINEDSQKEIIQFLFLSTIIPLFVIQIGNLSIALSIVLLILFVYFCFIVSKKASKTTVLKSSNYKSKLSLGIKFVISLALLVVISKYIVDSSINIASFFDIPPSIIGATIIGFGTSLPELTTTIQAFRKGLYDMGLGNLIGSCITNLTLVLGAASVVSFSTVNVIAAGSIMFFALLSTITMWYIVTMKKSIGRYTALTLSIIYLLFILQQLGFSIII
ncbi:MAG: sodium:calcium antiporter [Candidatus Bathyarchaeota archaeon]